MIKSHNIFLSETNYIPNKIPVAIKDNICVDGYKTTCGSKALQDYSPGYNATAVAKLLENGYYVAGKSNMDEFAMGSTGLNSAFGNIQNPLNDEYIAGGSSSGSAVAVASELVDLALGSDTGGSVRIPAAFCGVFGFKPTYGAISRYGLISFASSLDVIGILGNSLSGIEKLFKIISGKDTKDSTSIDVEIRSKINSKPKFAFLDIDYLNVSDEVKEFYNQLYSSFSLKNDTEIIKLNYINYWLSVYFIISSCEAVSNLSRYDNKLFGNFYHKIDTYEKHFPVYRSKLFGEEVKRRILTGNFALLNENYKDFYEKASKIRFLIKKEFESIFKKFNFLITPTSPILPFKPTDSNILKNYKIDLFTSGASLAGNPAISIPSRIKIDDFYPGIQLIGDYAKDYELMNISQEIDLRLN